MGGGGDLAQSVAQAMNASISDFDRDTILMQIHPQLTTQKVLLVGHSQGTFYTNSLYDYLVAHGVPSASIAVYNIATPASYVAAGGGYVTSTNDKFMNLVRDIETGVVNAVYANSYYTVRSSLASALRANIAVPKEKGWDENALGGHRFSVYLDGATERIVDDITGALGRLKAAPRNASVADGCFTPPVETLARKTEGVAFAVLDSTVGPVTQGAAKTIGSTLGAVGTAWGGLAWTVETVAESLTDGSLLGGVKKFFVPPSVEGQSAIAQLALDSIIEAEQNDGASASGAVDGTQKGSSSEEVAAAPEAPPQEQPREEPPPPSPQEQVTPAAQQATPPPPSVVPSAGVAPGFGGGGSPAATLSSAAGAASADTTQGNSSSSAASSVPVAAPQAPLSFSVASPTDGAYAATTSVVFSGASAAGALVLADVAGALATTTADQSGAWTLSFALAEGAHSVSLAAHSADNASATTTRSLTVDLTAPAAPAATVGECANSLLSSFCLVPSTSVTVSWSAVADVSSYAVYKNATLLGTTTSLAYALTGQDNATTTIEVVAFDAAGNAATSSQLSVGIYSKPLIVNEVGWGTDASARQFIELKNVSPYTLDLSHVAITRSSGSTIQLSGSLTPTSGITIHGYLTVLPSDSISLGINKLVTPFDALSASGEELGLVWSSGAGTTTIDRTPSVATCGGWCAGSASSTLGTNLQGREPVTTPLSMERSSDSSDGTLTASWRSTDSYALNNSGSRWGTPGVANSLDLPESGVFCGSTSNLVRSNAGFNPGTSGCTYLARFITPPLAWYGMLYKGDVGSATVVNGHGLAGLSDWGNDSVPDGSVAGDHFFFSIFEGRSGDYNDNVSFNKYFIGTASSTPHGNYVIIPWTYAP